MSGTDDQHGGDAWREAVSAVVDGEDPGCERAELERHVASCPDCQDFRRSAEAQRRRLRAVPAPVGPDLSDRILAALPSGAPPRVGRSGRTLSLPQLGIAAALVAVVVVAGYLVGTHVGGGSGGGQAANVQQVAGSTQINPLYPGATVLPAKATEPKPDIVFTDTAGRPYDMATATAGRVTLLYFGYTHCPDVCPVAMALTAEAVSGLPAAERKDVSVVFITTDPKRDSPTVIRHWLAGFSGQFGDPPFVGLTGSQALIHRAEKSVGMPLSYAETVDSSTGTYDVVHAGYILAYAPDGIAHLSIDETETPAQYTRTLHDLITKGFSA